MSARGGACLLPGLPVLALLSFIGPPTAQAQDAKACTEGSTQLQEMLDCASRLAGPGDGDAVTCADLSPLKFAEPTAGPRVLRFGDRTQFGSASKGVVIETASEAAVLAPAKGVVIFAGEYRSYGKLVVIDLGCDLRLLMAGLGTVTVQHADAVEQGVRLGAMAVAKGGANYLPVLYVELRRGGQTIDPGPEISGAR